jgi:alkanesulfonate monooxygenase SsuD/methylene tetrahydromethanopterin reductase-like flavin-dependent oxidoreductase (luciferase family)
VQRPIPVWMGGSAEPALRRIARIADGWISQLAPGSQAAEVLERVRTYVREAGRDPAAFGVEGRLHLGTTPQESWPQAVEMWRRLGGTHLAVNTMRSGLKSLDQHVAALRRFRDAVPHLGSPFHDRLPAGRLTDAEGQYAGLRRMTVSRRELPRSSRARSGRSHQRIGVYRGFSVPRPSPLAPSRAGLCPAHALHLRVLYPTYPKT